MNFKKNKQTQKGQMVIILLLVMVVTLAIALSVTNRSLTEIVTSTNTENSSRAFSAAEAGIEKILLRGPEIGLGTTGSLELSPFSNQASAQVEWFGDLPKAGTALEFPPYGKESFGKESFAQFWLASPSDLNCTSPASRCYSGDNFDVYFGDPLSPRGYSEEAGNLEDQPAIEVHVIYKNKGNGQYESQRYFYDSYTDGPNNERLNNNFNPCLPTGTSSVVTNNNTEESSFYCRVHVPPSGTFPANSQLIMARVRILYTNTAHTVALKPTTGSLPLQTNIYRSRGISGNVQRNLEVFRQKDVLPQFLDFALFSAMDLNKQ